MPFFLLNTSPCMSYDWEHYPLGQQYNGQNQEINIDAII